MSLLTTKCWVTASEEETRRLGSCLGRQAQGGDILTCCGPLGAGKTTFIQGFACGLGIGPDAYVRSPTFTLVHEYYGRLPLYHFDFYRLSDWAEVQDLGFDEYVYMGGVVIIEWADKFLEFLPAARLDISIRILSPTHRAFSGTVHEVSYVRYLKQDIHKGIR